MTLWRRPEHVERIGHYAFWNDVPGTTGGTWRQVFQRGVVPDPGAQVYGYSTFLIPNVDRLPNGGALRYGPPDPRSGGALLMADVQRPTPVQPTPTGFLQRFGLAPSVKATGAT